MAPAAAPRAQRIGSSSSRRTSSFEASGFRFSWTLSCRRSHQTFSQANAFAGEEDPLGQRDVGDGSDEHTEGAGSVAEDSVGGRIAGGGEVEDLVVAGGPS